MTTPFWGLYDGLGKKETKSDSQIEENNSKKRTGSDAGLVPRALTKKPAIVTPSMAPRVARMAQRGIKEEPKKNTHVESVVTSNSPPSVTEPEPVLAVLDSEPIDSFTKGLNEAKDPYDPTKPNDYQTIVRERLRLRLEHERKMKEEEELQRQQLLQLQQQIQQQLQQQQLQQQQLQQQQLQQQQLQQPAVPEENVELPPQDQGSKLEAGASKADMMLKKMGWKGKGYGLGKKQQGIANALIVQKTGTSQGVIINTDARRREIAPDLTPSPVVLLRVFYSLSLGFPENKKTKD